jgi:hypothetical protein
LGPGFTLTATFRDESITTFGKKLSQSLQDSENFIFIFIPCLARTIFQTLTEMAEVST